VLVAYDGSGASEAALAWVRRLRLPEGAEVRVGCVVEQVPLPVMSPDQVIPVEFYTVTEALERERRRQAEQKVEQAVNALRNEGLTAEAWVRAGNPVEEILGMAAEWPADLTVLGAHTHRSWHHDVMGNTARGVCRNLNGAVLVARSGPED
jgi:nucleotide-binding universal stress UspA family protein